jgi:hypothetical protein
MLLILKGANHMNIRKTAAMAALVFGAMLTQVARAGDQDFKLVNKTGVTIAKIMVSPADKKTWGDDIMGKDVVPDGGSVDITFAKAEEAEHWDLKIVDKDGTEIVWSNLNLLKISKLTIIFKDGKPTAEVE